MRSLLLCLLLLPRLALAVCDASGGAYSTEVCADSPFIYVRLNEPSGSSFTDLSGNGNHGTKVGSPTLGNAGWSGIAGSGSVYSNAQANRIEFGDIFDRGTSDFTAEGWVKLGTTGGPYHVLFGKGFNPGWTLEASAGQPASGYCGSGSGIQFFTGTSNSSGSWIHFVMRRTSTVVTVHRNAVDVTSGSPVDCSEDVSGTTPLSLFFVTTFSDPDMYLSEVAFYTTSLSSERIHAHYSCGAAGVNCSGARRVIIDTRWKPQLPEIPELLARGLAPFLSDEPWFRIAALNDRAELVAGQYDH
jgi:hypothetical protein